MMAPRDQWIKDQLAALADEKGVESIYPAILLRLSQTSREVLRLRRRKRGDFNRQPRSEHCQQMTAIQSAHLLLPGSRTVGADRQR